MTPFSFMTAGRILFGRGSAQDTARLAAGFGTRILLVRGRTVDWVETLLNDLRSSGCEFVQHVQPTEPTVADVTAALDLGRRFGAKAVIAVGGGSVIDLGKAAAALLPGKSGVMDHLEVVGKGRPLSEAPLPFIAIPTTAGTGAEVTKNAVIGVPEAGRKVSLRDDRMMPEIAIVDPALTDGAPRGVTLASGLDAITQVIEPYLSSRANPLTDALCREAIPRGLAALARLMQDESPAMRDELAFVSLTGGIALSNAGLGAVHGLAGIIGGRFQAPHGVICGRLLGPVLAANRAEMARAGADLTRFDEVAISMGAAFGLPHDKVFERLGDRLDRLGVPRLGRWLDDGADIGALARDALGSSSMKANPCDLPAPALEAAILMAT